MATKSPAFTQSLVNKLEPKTTRYDVWDGKCSGLIIRVYPTGKKIYWCVYSVKGSKTREKIGDVEYFTISEARNRAKEIQVLAVKEGKTPTERKRSAKQNTGKLGDFYLNEFTPHCIAHDKSHGDILRRLHRNFGHLFAKKIKELSVEDINAWRAMKDKERKPNGEPLKFQTIEKEFVYFKKLLNWAVTQDYEVSSRLLKYTLTKSIRDYKDIASSRDIERQLNADEEKALRKALVSRENELREARASHNLWLKARGRSLMPVIRKDRYADYLEPLVLFSLTTGIRKGDLFRLKWSNVDLSVPCISFVVGKTEKHKPVPSTFELSPEAAAILAKWKKSSDGNELIFPSPVTGKPFNNINNAWKSLLEKAGIGHFRFYDLRHTFCTEIGKVADIATASALMGHSSFATTKRYLHSDRARKLEALNKAWGKKNERKAG